MNEQTKKSQFRIEQVFTSVGLSRSEVTQSEPGDIIAITGTTDAGIGDTITDPSDPVGFPTIKLEEPTLKILIAPNTSPLAGREGEFSTARQIYQRLLKEKQTNIGLRIEENPSGPGFIVSGRGELHLAVLIENLRREGYEMQVSKPEVIIKENNGVKEEPFEELTVEIDSNMVGVIAEELGKRRAEMLDTHTDERGLTKMVYKVSSRNLLGFRSDILTKTRGKGVFATRIIGYFPLTAHIPKLRNGVLISWETGVSSAYALTTVQERGAAFIGPGIPVYEGMIIGLNRQQADIDINVCKTKKLTNIHSANADVAIQLDPPMVLSLEQCLDFIEEDELLEVTPQNLRLRKKHLSKVNRVRAQRTVS